MTSLWSSRGSALVVMASWQQAWLNDCFFCFLKFISRGGRPNAHAFQNMYYKGSASHPPLILNDRLTEAMFSRLGRVKKGLMHIKVETTTLFGGIGANIN